MLELHIALAWGVINFINLTNVYIARLKDPML